MKGKLLRRITAATLMAVTAFTLGGCGTGKNNMTAGKSDNSEKITIRILENDTAKKSGYLEALIKSFNEAYKDKGIEAVDANMEEYTDLAANGPYGYGPDVIYQANDQIMAYAEDKHILPIEVDKLDCYEQIPESAWDAYKIVVDGKTYYCGVPVNIQEPMLFYREDMLPDDWQTNWDKNENGTPDFFENWNDLYAYSKLLRESDTSATRTEKYGFMQSLRPQ